MSQDQIITILMICIAIILIASGIKLTAWLRAKKNGSTLRFFFSYYFKWFDMYALWDSTDELKKQFMKVNNNTNLVIWIVTAIGSTILYIFYV